MPQRRCDMGQRRRFTPEFKRQAVQLLNAGQRPAAGFGAIPRPTGEVQLWDPSTQLRFKRKGHVPPRPDGAPNTAPAAGR